MKLTVLGREQLQFTGQRLNKLNITFDRLIHSTMIRAIESAQIINEQLERKLNLIEDQDLAEGLPIAPIPYAGISQEYVNV
jgi:serine/threonine-protein phosphatase PGAM5